MMSQRITFAFLTIAAVWVVAVSESSEGLTAQEPARAEKFELLANGKTKAILHSEYIPVPGAAYCHPSGIAVTSQGTTVVAASAGESEGENTTIVVLRKTKTGWEKTGQFKPRGRSSGFDPQLFQPKRKDAPLLLFYYNGCCEDQYMRTSTDDGKSWSEEIALPSAKDVPGYNQDRFEGPEQNPPLEMPNGWLWCSHTRRGRGYSQSWISMIPPDNYTGKENKGTQWQAIKTPGASGQGSLLVRNPKELEKGIYKQMSLVIRTGVGTPAAILHTEDAGKTWTEPEKFKVVNNIGDNYNDVNAGVTALSLDVAGGKAQGIHLVAGAGNLIIDKKRIDRGCIRLLSSKDAKSWEEVLELRITTKTDQKEQADPTLLQGPDRRIHLLWTGRHATGFRYVILDPDVIKGE